MADLAPMNPYTGFRSVPIDPVSRFPAEGAEVLANTWSYDFGAARPARILKSAKGNRGMVDKEATMRANLMTVNGEDEGRDLGGSWGQSPRLAGDSSGKRPRSRPRPRRRTDTNRPSSSQRLLETAGRFAHTAGSLGAGYHGTQAELNGLTQHLSNLDIGAGTPGDSMVTQFPIYRAPLTHPFLPSAAVAAQALQADAYNPQPMNPSMFAASIEELRQAAAAVHPPQPGVLSRSERDKQEKARRKQAAIPASEEAKTSIDQYLKDTKELEKQHKAQLRAGGGSHSRHSSHAEREKNKYAARVAKLEAELLHLHSAADKGRAKEAWKVAEEKYAAIADASTTAGHAGAGGKKKSQQQRSSGFTLDASSPDVDEFGEIPPTDDAGRKAQHIAQLHGALARGDVLGKDFLENLEALKAKHKENLAAVEDLYYQQKLTAKLGQTLVTNSAQQLEMMGENGRQLAATVGRGGPINAWSQQQAQQLQQQQYLQQQQQQGGIQLANNPLLEHPDLSRVTDPRELAYRMGQSLRRDPRQTAPGVADSDDARENAAKKRLAAMFESGANSNLAGIPRTAPRPRPSTANGAEDLYYDEDDASAIEVDPFGRPVWKEVKNEEEDDESIDLNEPAQRPRQPKQSREKHEKVPRGNRGIDVDRAAAKSSSSSSSREDKKKKKKSSRDRYQSSSDSEDDQVSVHSSIASAAASVARSSKSSRSGSSYSR